MRAFVATLLGALALIPLSVGAVDRAVEDEEQAVIEIGQARAMIAVANYALAETFLRAANLRTPEDPDVHSLLGFCARKLGRLDESYAHYQQALRLNPDHMGAREYLGELYLQRGEPELAHAQLAELERLCPQGCEERSELAEAIRTHAAATSP
jgi:Flp pilus assembly protein TadD